MGPPSWGSSCLATPAVPRCADLGPRVRCAVAPSSLPRTNARPRWCDRAAASVPWLSALAPPRTGQRPAPTCLLSYRAQAPDGVGAPRKLGGRSLRAVRAGVGPSPRSRCPDVDSRADGRLPRSQHVPPRRGCVRKAELVRRRVVGLGEHCAARPAARCLSHRPPSAPGSCPPRGPGPPLPPASRRLPPPVAPRLHPAQSPCRLCRKAAPRVLSRRFSCSGARPALCVLSAPLTTPHRVARLLTSRPPPGPDVSCLGSASRPPWARGGPPGNAHRRVMGDGGRGGRHT